MAQISIAKMPAWRGAGLMVAAGFVFAVVNTLVQYVTMVLQASSVSVAFWQYLVAACMFGPWLWVRRSQWAHGLTFEQLIRVALGAIGVQLWVSGLAQVPIWQAIALIMSSPLFVTLGAGVFLGETVGPRRWGAVLIGAMGTMVILAPWSESFTTAAFLPLAAAAFWAGASLMTKRLSSTQSAESLTAYLLLLMVPINGVIGISSGLKLPALNAVAGVVLAGVLVALAQYFVAQAYSMSDAAFLQPFDHLKLVFNVLLGIAAFGFTPPGTLWLGAILIVGALFLLEREPVE